MEKKTVINVIMFYFTIIGLFTIGTILGNRLVYVLSENTPISRIHTIVIDPGHGGEDGGATSCTGILESRYNLEISLRLRDLLHLLGYQTVMTRETDSSIYTSGNTISQRKMSDLKERVRIAEMNKQSVYISIHQNFFQEQKYSGAQVFYGKGPGSKELAGRLQTMLVSTINCGSHRKEKSGSGIYILEKIASPSILVECGFISNPTEEELLSTPDYQKHLGSVISCAVISYLHSTIDHK